MRSNKIQINSAIKKYIFNTTESISMIYQAHLCIQISIQKEFNDIIKENVFNTSKHLFHYDV